MGCALDRFKKTTFLKIHGLPFPKVVYKENKHYGEFLFEKKNV